MFHIAQICTCFVCFPFFNPRYFAARRCSLGRRRNPIPKTKTKRTGGELEQRSGRGLTVRENVELIGASFTQLFLVALQPSVETGLGGGWRGGWL